MSRQQAPQVAAVELVIAGALGVPPGAVLSPDDFDSFGVLVALVAVEEAFGVELPDGMLRSFADEVADLGTVGAVEHLAAQLGHSG